MEGQDREWTGTPWFLKGDSAQEAALSDLGYSREFRSAAFRQLARLYPSLGRELALEGGFFSPLLEPSRPEAIAPFLDVGLDLEVSEAWSDATMLARLHSSGEFEDAALELRVFANASRAGYHPRRIPQGAGKSADFLVRIGALEDYELEVKGRGEVELVRLADEFNKRLAEAPITVLGLHLALEGSDELHARVVRDRGVLATEGHAIIAAFSEAVRKIGDEGGKPGVRYVPPYGRIVATPGGQSATPDILADVAVGQRASQAVRLVTRANRQFQTRKGIVFLDVRRRADMANVAREVVRVARNLSNCRMVVVADALSDEQGGGRTRPVALATPVIANRELPKALLKFAQAIAGRRGESAKLLDLGVQTGHLRHGVTVVKLTEYYRQADGTLQVRVPDLLPRGRDK